VAKDHSADPGMIAQLSCKLIGKRSKTVDQVTIGHSELNCDRIRAEAVHRVAPGEGAVEQCGGPDFFSRRECYSGCTASEDKPDLGACRIEGFCSRRIFETFTNVFRDSLEPDSIRTVEFEEPTNVVKKRMLVDHAREYSQAFALREPSRPLAGSPGTLRHAVAQTLTTTEDGRTLHLRIMSRAKFLFIADTHLGFDYTLHPRIERRRRGDDFFANYYHAIETARRERVDFVIHGGDLFYRSKVPQAIVVKAFEPLIELASDGIPVFIVPGNHERSKIPVSLFALHDNIHIFSEPTSYSVEVGGLFISLSGFPYLRNNIRRNYRHTIAQLRTTWPEHKADVRLLCMHHIVEGAKVGAFDYTFRDGPEVIRGDDITDDFDVVLSGHIHRFQILTADLHGKPLLSHVYYPGAIERTSFAERNEVKGYLLLEIRLDADTERPLLSHQFIPLPARPMVAFDIRASELTEENIENRIGGLLQSQDANSVVRISVRGELNAPVAAKLTARSLRRLAPPTMNVDLSFPGRLPHVDEAL
jgi:DNA repair protein SbcD/Mre11